MPVTADLRYAFNRGEIGKHTLARVDRDGLRLAAETMENWMPLPQGPMMLRPGSAYLGTTLDNAEARYLPFVFSRTDTALVELTDGMMRVWVDDELVTRPNITTTLSASGDDGTFTSAAGWVLTRTSGATATITGGVLTLTATARGSTATCKRTVVLPVASQNIEHALRIDVDRGPVFFKVGSAPGKDDYVKRTKLGTGIHSLAFTPATKFSIEFENTDRAARIVNSCTLEDNEDLELPTVWETDDFDKIQINQSGDIIFVACEGRKQQKIERRSATSWSVVDYEGQLGPLRVQKPREQDIYLTATAYEGNGRLVASSPLWKDEHVGTTVRVFPTGQVRQAQLAGEDIFTDSIRVSGVGVERLFTVRISGTWSGRLILQSSLEGPDYGFKEVPTDFISGYSGFVPTTTSFEVDEKTQNENAIVWYRVGFAAGDYKGGVATVFFSGYGSSGGADATDGTGADKTGGQAAYARITAVISSTIAEVEVLKPFSSLSKTKDWMMGEWNEDDGYPSSVTLFDGRLWWAYKDRLWGSVSDDFENFDHDFIGDAGPISRSLGAGPVDTISWLLPLSRLMAGRGAAVSSVRSSNFDEPLTPTNFTIKDATTRGAGVAQPGQIDSRGVYIHANGRQLIELLYRVDVQDYATNDLTNFNADIGLPVFKRLAVARSPDTRIFIVRDDGQIAVCLREQDGDVQLASWWRINRDIGTYEDVVVLPDETEDRVYAVVRVGNSRFLEAFARRDECIGEPLTKTLDSHIIYSGSATRTITGLTHLRGKTVRVWGSATSTADNGRYLGEYVVSASGTVGKLPINVTTAVVGLPYTATFLSAKLAYGAGLSIGMIKHIDQISLVLFDTHAKGLQFGQDLTHLEPLPLMEDGEEVDEDYVWSHYDKPVTSLRGRWDIDARLALQTMSPYPTTVGAVMISVDVSVRAN